MKNPFEKKDNTALVAGIAIGAVAAGAAAYLLLTEKGSRIRKQIADEFGNLVNKFLGGAEEADEQPGYDFRQQHATKTPKTDIAALVKDEVLSHTQH